MSDTPQGPEHMEIKRQDADTSRAEPQKESPWLVS